MAIYVVAITELQMTLNAPSRVSRVLRKMKAIYARWASDVGHYSG